MTTLHTDIFDPEFLYHAIGIKETDMAIEIYEEFIFNMKQLLDLFGTDEVGNDAIFIAVHNSKASSRAIGANHLADIFDSYESVILEESIDFSFDRQKMRFSILQTIEIIDKYVETLKADIDVVTHQ